MLQLLLINVRLNKQLVDDKQSVTKFTSLMSTLSLSVFKDEYTSNPSVLIWFGYSVLHSPPRP